MKMTMKTTRIKAVAAVILAVVLMMSATSAKADAPQQYGRFKEIRHSQYLGPTGERMYEYLMYDMTTMLVYIYTTDCKGLLSITPYLMRDYYGQITCGLYNKETGGVDPAELSFFVEDDEWDIPNTYKGGG